MLIPEQFIGIPEEDAVTLIKEAKWSSRVTRRDREHFTITMDYRGNRINLQVDNGIITYAHIG